MTNDDSCRCTHIASSSDSLGNLQDLKLVDYDLNIKVGRLVRLDIWNSPGMLQPCAISFGTFYLTAPNQKSFAVYIWRTGRKLQIDNGHVAIRVRVRLLTQYPLRYVGGWMYVARKPEVFRRAIHAEVEAFFNDEDDNA